MSPVEKSTIYGGCIKRVILSQALSSGFILRVLISRVLYDAERPRVHLEPIKILLEKVRKKHLVFVSNTDQVFISSRMFI